VCANPDTWCFDIGYAYEEKASHVGFKPE